MSKLSLLISGLALFAALYAAVGKLAPDHVTQKEFKAAHVVLNAKLDSLNIMVSELNVKIDNLQADTDTIKKDLNLLKGGQGVIFEEVKKSNDKSFLNELKKMFE